MNLEKQLAKSLVGNHFAADSQGIADAYEKALESLIVSGTVDGQFSAFIESQPIGKTNRLLAAEKNHCTFRKGLLSLRQEDKAGVEACLEVFKYNPFVIVRDTYCDDAGFHISVEIVNIKNSLNQLLDSRYQIPDINPCILMQNGSSKVINSEDLYKYQIPTYILAYVLKDLYEAISKGVDGRIALQNLLGFLIPQVSFRQVLFLNETGVPTNPKNVYELYLEEWGLNENPLDFNLESKEEFISHLQETQPTVSSIVAEFLSSRTEDAKLEDLLFSPELNHELAKRAVSMVSPWSFDPEKIEKFHSGYKNSVANGFESYQSALKNKKIQKYIEHFNIFKSQIPDEMKDDKETLDALHSMFEISQNLYLIYFSETLNKLVKMFGFEEVTLHVGEDIDCTYIKARYLAQGGANVKASIRGYHG